MRHFISLVVLAGLITLSVVAQAAVPKQISYQGRLTDDTGQPLNTSAVITFRIYSQPASGSALWIERHEDVVVTEGLFNVTLGVDADLGKIFAGATMYLSIQVAAGAESDPRIPMISVPYAIAAGHADTATYALTVGGGAEGPWIDAGTTIHLTNAADSVGIGTATPGAKLHVDGDVMLSAGHDLLFGGGNTKLNAYTDDLTISADDNIALVPSNQIRIRDYGGADWSSINPAMRTFGLGTLAPTEMLHLYTQTAGERAFIKLESAHATDWDEVGLRLETPDNRWHWRMDDASHNNLEAGAISLRSQEINDEVMTWNADGAVGVATAHPTEKLDINGNLRVRDDIDVEGALTAGQITGNYAANSVLSSDILNEAGIASTNAALWTQLGGSYIVGLTREITVPAGGYVLALASVNMKLEHGISGGTFAYIGISDDPDDDSPSPLFSAGAGSNVAAGSYYHCISGQKLFSVPSAGTYTFYMLAKRGSDNSAVLGDSQMDLIYIPTSYASKGGETAADDDMTAALTVLRDATAGDGTRETAISTSVDNAADDYATDNGAVHQEIDALKAELAALKVRLSALER